MIEHTPQTQAQHIDGTPATQARHIDDTPATHREPYSTNFLADELGVGPGTIRSRWYGWIKQIAPEALLKSDQGWSELARTLFAEFKQVPKSERKKFISDAKARFSPEWGPAGITECELMPESANNALALISQGNVNLSAALEASMQAAIELSQALDFNQANIDQAEIERWQIEGAMKGIARFQITSTAAAQTYSDLISRAGGREENAKK